MTISDTVLEIGGTIVALCTGLAWGAIIEPALKRRRIRKRGPRTLVIDYSSEGQGLGMFTVTACYCNACRNAFFAQHVRVEAPKGCPYCLREFSDVATAEAEEMRRLLVSDEENNQEEKT